MATETMSMIDALQQYGSQSREYRRAWSREYRARTRRVDYYPDRRASMALDEAVANGWALSYNEAISKALVFWRDWQMGEFEDYEQ
jgi:hypothetical protein